MRIHLLFPRGTKAISSAMSSAILVVLWILFAPTQVGGLASYVIVVGSSMETNFHVGDLVIVHKETFYQVGDAVVYRNDDLQGFVFHRIIAEEDGRFSLQGDNNPWVDRYQPLKEEILGKLWLYIPRGGLVFQKMRNPFIMALVAAVLGVFLSSGLLGHKTKGNTHMKKKSVREWFESIKQKTRNWLANINGPESNVPSNVRPGGILEGSFFVLALISLLSLFIGIISFSRPASRIVSNEIQYQQLGIFSYLAPAPQAIYDSNAIKSGDPVFPSLTCVIDVNLQYTLIAPGSKNLSGTYQLTAIVREKLSGWQREFPLQDQTPFTGNTFGTTTKLDLCKVASLTQSMEQETSFHPGTYTLSINPNIKVNGELSGYALDTTFESGLIFLYDRVHFYLPQENEDGTLLSITETETIKSDRSEANTVVFLGNQIPVPGLRWFAITGLITSLAGFVFLGLRLQKLSQTDQPRFFRVKYDSLIVDIHSIDSLVFADSINVASMDALAKLAERFNAVVLHVERDNSHEYYVQAGGVTYTFALPARILEPAVPGTDAASQEVTQ